MGSRWPTSARFLFRSLSLRGPAFLLALLAVTAGATMIATVLNLEAGLREKMSRELRAYGPNLLLLPPAAAAPAEDRGATLDETVIERARSVLGDQVAIAPVLLAAGAVGNEAATLVGTDLGMLRRLYPGWRLLPAAPPALQEMECIAGVSVARRAALTPGDEVEIRAGGSMKLRMAAIVETGEAEDERVFMPLSILQEATGRQGRISLATLSIEGGAHAVEEAARRLATAVPGIEARPLRALARAEGAILARLDRMMILLTLVVLILSGLCLVTTLMSMVVERETEVGLARALGAGDGEIFRMFLGEVGLLGVLGALLGAGLGALLVRFIGRGLFGAAIEPRLWVVPAVFAAALLICLFSVLLPLRRALSIQPAAALRGE